METGRLLMAETVDLDSLLADYGYVPSEDGRDDCSISYNLLIVKHPDRPPRVYGKGCQGHYAEMENGWPW